MRSKARWVDYGKKNIRCFLNLEKKERREEKYYYVETKRWNRNRRSGNFWCAAKRSSVFFFSGYVPADTPECGPLTCIQGLKKLQKAGYTPVNHQQRQCQWNGPRSSYQNILRTQMEREQKLLIKYQLLYYNNKKKQRNSFSSV